MSYFKMIGLLSMAAVNGTELREATKSIFVNLFLNSLDLPLVTLEKELDTNSKYELFVTKSSSVFTCCA